MARATVPYVDDERDSRDCLLLGAIKGAIQLVEDGESQPEMALAVLRLARDRLEASWPATDVKFVAEVSHGRATTRIDNPPVDTRLRPYLVDTIAATGTLDEAIGALTLAFETVLREAGTNEALSHAFGCMRLVIESLDKLRDRLSEAESVEVSHG
jgi:hypothetical protein